MAESKISPKLYFESIASASIDANGIVSLGSTDVYPEVLAVHNWYNQSGLIFRPFVSYGSWYASVVDGSNNIVRNQTANITVVYQK